MTGGSEEGELQKRKDKAMGKNLNQYAANYVVFDFETTGINVNKDKIIEISAIKVRNHHPKEEFSALVNPGIPIPEGASRVNGITDDLVKGCPGIETVLAEFLDFIGEDVLVGHNIGAFDMVFLDRGARESLFRPVFNDYVDTLSLARVCLPQLGRHRLTDIAAYFGIETQGAHRALNDCRMNQQCYEKIGQLLEGGQVERCPRCGGLLKKRNGRFGAFYGCSNFPQCRYTRNIEG